jgi:hypothetical protein
VGREISSVNRRTTKWQALGCVLAICHGSPQNCNKRLFLWSRREKRLVDLEVAVEVMRSSCTPDMF